MSKVSAPALEMRYTQNSKGDILGGGASLSKNTRLAKLPAKEPRSLSQDKQSRIE